MRTDKISVKQVAFITYIAMIVEVFIKPSQAVSSLSAKSMVVFAILDAVFTLLICLPVVKLLDKWQTTTSCALELFAAAILLLAAVDSIIQTEGYYRFVSDKKMPAVLLIAIVLAIVAYGATQGIEAVARASLVVLVIFCCTFFLLIAANISQFKITNLQFEFTGRENWAKALFGSLSFPPEIIIFLVAQRVAKGEKAKAFSKTILTLLGTYIVLAVSTEMVLGSFASLQSQPAHTLARIGSLSVFTRLDAVHVSVWLLLAIFKITTNVAVALTLIKPYVPPKYKDKLIYGLIAALSVLCFGCYMCHITNMKTLLRCATVIFVLSIYVIKKVRANKDAKV
ncbi:MAG: GerAB/ArcD/ProY family transporter [Oscillospiraceae bacterium]|nr:GerAB/ArcD/ProY family transporter [Oscillospiraceae bacterium]